MRLKLRAGDYIEFLKEAAEKKWWRSCDREKKKMLTGIAKEKGLRKKRDCERKGIAKEKDGNGDREDKKGR